MIHDIPLGEDSGAKSLQVWKYDEAAEGDPFVFALGTRPAMVSVWPHAGRVGPHGNHRAHGPRGGDPASRRTHRAARRPPVSYIRVIPRDLFNEANLLKCYGQLYLLIERLNLPDVTFEHTDPRAPFHVEQDMGDGGLTVTNVVLTVRGKRITMRRPINSREPWPLMVIGADDEEIPVFDDAGQFSPEMLAILVMGAP